MTRDEVIARARAETWRTGDAHHWALDEGQQAWRRDFLATPPLSSTVWNIGRQRGKTYDAVYLSLETGTTQPGAIIRYCAKTKDSAVGIVMPAWNALVATMPPDLRPVQGRSDYEWLFPSTGATFVLFGTDAQSFTKGRGPRTDLQLLDECGFYQDLLSVESALMPSLQTTGGRALYLSTPAESLGHTYTQRIRGAMASGRYQHDTFWSNPRVDHEAVIREEAARRGETREAFLVSTYFRREYLAELVSEESRAALPAWTRELHALVVGDWERPEYFDAYSAHDPGISGDPHASLFAYHDPSAGVLVIEDEMELKSAANSTKMWADAVKLKEAALYGTQSWNGTMQGAASFLENMSDAPVWIRRMVADSYSKQPFLRVGDNAQDVCQDMSLDHGLAMLPTAKHEKGLEVSNLNHALAHGKIRIHSRCVRLIEQCYSTAWNNARTEWQRSDRDHGDLVDDLLYLNRNVRWHRDCRPKKPIDRFLFKPPAPASGWSKMVKPG